MYGAPVARNLAEHPPPVNATHSMLFRAAQLHHGAGAYVCGEETALLESLEGKHVRQRIGVVHAMLLPHSAVVNGSDAMSWITHKACEGIATVPGGLQPTARLAVGPVARRR